MTDGLKNIFDKLQYHQLSDKYGYSDMFERVGEKKSTNWEAIIYESYAWFPRRSNSLSHLPLPFPLSNLSLSCKMIDFDTPLTLENH